MAALAIPCVDLVAENLLHSPDCGKMASVAARCLYPNGEYAATRSMEWTLCGGGWLEIVTLPRSVASILASAVNGFQVYCIRFE